MLGTIAQGAGSKVRLVWDPWDGYEKFLPSGCVFIQCVSFVVF